MRSSTSLPLPQTNSEDGLYVSRKPELLFEDEVVVNIGGLPSTNSSTQVSLSLPSEINPVRSSYEGAQKISSMAPSLLAILAASTLMSWIRDYLLLLPPLLSGGVRKSLYETGKRMESIVVIFATSALVLQIWKIFLHLLPTPVLHIITVQADRLTHLYRLIPTQTTDPKTPAKEYTHPISPIVQGPISNTARRCTILDMSFRTDRVDDAPVNRRA
jgi:hypothetical protein